MKKSTCVNNVNEHIDIRHLYCDTRNLNVAKIRNLNVKYLIAGIFRKRSLTLSNISCLYIKLIGQNYKITWIKTKCFITNKFFILLVVISISVSFLLLLLFFVCNCYLMFLIFVDKSLRAEELYKFTCNRCNKVYKRLNSLIAHRSKKCQAVIYYNCPEKSCHYVSKFKQNLKRHYNTLHID